MKIYFLSFFTAVMLLLPSAAKAQMYGPVNAWFDTDSLLYNIHVHGGYLYEKIALLYPDSGVFWIDNLEVRHETETFSIGHIFNVTHPYWAAVPSPSHQSVAPVGLSCPFTWDSLQFYYFYERLYPNTAVIDTLFIYYYNNFADTMLKSDLYVVYEDTLSMARLSEYKYSTLSGKKYFRVDTVLLDTNYVANVSTPKQYKTDINIAYNPKSPVIQKNIDCLIGYSLVYKPGYPANIGDTIFSLKSGRSIATNTLGVYEWDVDFFDPFGDIGSLPVTYTFNQNTIRLDKNNRYGGNHNGIEGFIPDTTSYGMKILRCAAYVTSTSCPLSVNQLTTTKGTFIKSISPNPVSGANYVVVEVNTSTPAQLKVQLRDVLGNLLFETEPQNVDGEEFFKINIAQSKGVNFVLLVDCQSNTVLATSKVIVAK